jgi:hypothetical protein
VSKRRWTELNVKEDDEVHQEQEDDMSSLSEASVGIQSFQDNTQHDDGYADNWDDGAEADDEAVMSFTATHGCANQHQHNLPPNLSSCDPPPLGTIVEDPLEDALSRLPSLLQYESTLLKLDQILSGPRTRTTYDDVVSWLELALHDNTFKDKPKLPRRKALMKCLAEKFKMPPHELVPVTLESGTENGGVDEFHPGKTVNVPRWDFQKVVISYLLDPILFGNRDNLVSTDNPWEKFEIANPKESKEYLASNHYSQSFDESMDDVDDGCVQEQFFFPIEIYVDKSGKTAGQTSSCGEPVLMSTPLLTRSKHEEPSSWMLLGYIPDLEKTSSAKKQQESQRKFEKGRN